jgi:integrase
MTDHELVLYRGKWCLYHREDGRPIRRSTGTADKAEALRVVERIERLEAERLRPQLTFKDLWSRYQKHLGDRPAARTMKAEAKAVLPHFGDLPPSSINRKICDDYIAKRHVAGRADGTILTELNRVRSCFSFALNEQLIDRAPPMSFPHRPPPRDRYLTREEFARLLEACEHPHVRLFLSLALATAGRQEAILQLTWNRVDLERRLLDLRLPGHRGKSRSIVPINDSLLRELESAKGGSRCDSVISWGRKPVANVRKAVERAARKAGLAGVSPHVLRHTAAVWLAESGRPMSEIAQFLGHSDSRVTERVYARYSPTYLRQSASALEF